MEEKTMGLKGHIIKLLYSLSFKFFRFAIYSRQPFPRYPYMFKPKQLQTLANLLLSTNCKGSIVEVGCDQGWTTCYLAEAMKEAEMDRPYICIDTFSGFLKADYEFEYTKRNKEAQNYEGYFKINDKKWVDYSIQRAGYHNIRTSKADASTFNYETIAPIAFCLLDIDLYIPVKRALPKIFKHMSTEGIIVVDDCEQDGIWDGAYQAYIEFCNEIGIEQKIVCGQLGIIVKTQGIKGYKKNGSSQESVG